MFTADFAKAAGLLLIKLSMVVWSGEIEKCQVKLYVMVEPYPFFEFLLMANFV